MVKVGWAIMFKIKVKHRDGFAKLQNVKTESCIFETPFACDYYNDAYFSPCLDARVSTLASETEKKHFSCQPVYRFTAHTPREITESFLEKTISLEKNGDIFPFYASVYPEVNEKQLDFAKKMKFDFVWLKNTEELEGKKLVTLLHLLRESLPDTILMASRHSINLIPFLIYCGIDIVDLKPALVAGASGRHYLQGHLVDDSDIETSDSAIKGNNKKIKDLLTYIQYKIKKKELRQLIEEYAVKNVELMRLLRFWDSMVAASYSAVSLSSAPAYVSAESFYRPEVRRWVERLKERYSPPDLPVLLLLPCSATKPYSLSKTHREIRESMGRPGSIHEIIVTSPLGAVPRELEEMYPAAHYDSPVTGNWSDEEVNRSVDLVESMIKKGCYKEMYAYLSGGYTLVLEELKARGHNIHNFSDLDELKDKLGDDTHRSFGVEAVKAGFAFQFGTSIDTLVDDFLFRKNKVRTPDKKILLVRDKSTGFFQLTLTGAIYFGNKFPHIVDIGPFDFMTNIFAAGVIEASESIQLGDEIVIRQEGDIVAIGEAAMSGKEMVQATRGIALYVREKIE